MPLSYARTKSLSVTIFVLYGVNVAITVLAYKEALLFGRAKRAVHARTPERAAKLRRAKELSRLPSRATRACTFHDIPQMESLLAGYYCTLLLVKGSNV